MILCWLAFTAIRGSMQPSDHKLDTYTLEPPQGAKIIKAGQGHLPRLQSHPVTTV